ncbi:sugar phosphate isomerase/epimerase family protein [Urbifossiella limnaea]|uniref:Xylose isomerase-like TIM barrel n=1 Tax=Urbifossiella limnaea TaxID=2528023 RepID=A0A517XUE4_9BACT|nr:sugar phosphate isomerase/epimerase [Urbifossiella limnaea]QDU21133.1 Xylose isomerase-like TIM barrel [Urbifossiella limnaea]
MSAPLSRRSFLQAGAATAAGLLAATPAGAAGDLVGDISLGVQSYTFRQFNLEQALRRMKDLGIKNAEFYNNHIPQASTPQQLSTILGLCKEYEVTPVGFGVQAFTDNHDANKRVFDFGKALGVKYLSADPTPNSFDSLDKLVAEYNIAIAIHPHGPSGKALHRWYSAEVIMRAVRDHHRLIGACLDTGHLIRAAQLGERLDPAQQIRHMGARNFGMHVKDHDNRRKEDVVFGDPTGALNVAQVLAALREVRFNGAICIEYEAHPQDPSPDMKKCVDHVRDVARRAT